MEVVYDRKKREFRVPDEGYVVINEEGRRVRISDVPPRPRPGYFDRTTGSIVYGRSYGEFSFNGEPLYPGPLTDFLEEQPHTPSEPTRPLDLFEQKKRVIG